MKFSLRTLYWAAVLLWMLSIQIEIAASPQASSGQAESQFFLTALAKDNSPAVLQETALSVRVDKAVAQVKSVRSVKDDPLLFAVVVDLSKSDASSGNPIKEAAFQLFQGLASAQNEGYLVLFNDDVATTEAPISVSEAKKALDSATFAGGTVLYDANEITCRQRLSRSENRAVSRRVIVLISDGEDDASHATHTKAEQAALQEGVSVFSIVIKGPMSGVRGEKVLKEVSQMTGGVVIDKALKQAVPLSLAAIKAQWAVTLVSTQSADRNLHSLQIKCTQKDVRISAPSGVLFE